MKKFYFSALMLCSFFLMNQIHAQTAASQPVSSSQDLYAGFKAYSEKDNIVVLRWHPLDESGVDHFVIERSADSVHFSELRELVAQGGIGQDHAYEDEDSYPPAQVNYYRLKVVDHDGNALYSPAVAVDMTGETVLQVKPSVISAGSTLRLNSHSYFPEPLFIDFFNANGVRVGSFLVNNNTFNVNTSNWGRGLYFYRISDTQHPLINSGKILVL
jgi:hypothetical protein